MKQPKNYKPKEKLIMEDIFSDSELYSIMYDYMIKEKELKEIYKGFEKRIPYEYFTQTPSRIFRRLDIMDKIYPRLQAKTDFKILGNKTESYYQTEEEMLSSKEITHKNLSMQEKEIYWELCKNKR